MAQHHRPVTNPGPIQSEPLLPVAVPDGGSEPTSTPTTQPGAVTIIHHEPVISPAPITSIPNPVTGVSTSPPATNPGGGGGSTTPPILTSLPIVAVIDYGPMGIGGDATTGWQETNGGAGVTNAWDYLRQQVESAFTDFEGNLEAITTSSLGAGTEVAVGEVAAGAALDIGALPEVLLAGGLLLGVGVFGWLERWIGEHIPNPGIFGFHPLGFLKDGITNGGQALENQAMGIAGTVGAIFITPIRQVVGVVQRIINAVAGAHNKSAAIVNTHLPQARHEAVVTASAYADQAIATALSNTQLEIATLRSDVQREIADANATQSKNLNANIKAMETDLVNRLQGDESALAILATTVTTTLPLEIQTAVNDAAATENQRLSATSAAIESQVTALQGQIAALDTAMANNEAAIANAQAQITTLESRAVVDESALAAQQAIIAKAQTDIATSITAIQDLNTKITGISDTLAPVKAAQQLNTTQLAPFEIVGAVALPAIVAALTSELGKLKTKVDTCMVDNCDPANPNNIKNVLKDLLMAMSAAGELAFIAEAVRDPLGTADTLAPALDAVDSGAVALLHGLLSL